MERRNAWKIYTADQLKELDQINSRYKVCLDEGKTERECVRLTVKEIEKKGYRDLKDIKGSLKAGDKVYPDRKRTTGKWYEYSRSTH